LPKDSTTIEITNLGDDTRQIIITSVDQQLIDSLNK